MNIDKAIRIFSLFLNNSWDIIQPLLTERLYTTDEGSKNDWLQSNWEMLVERKVLQLNEYLQVYGEGADFNGESSRITDQESKPTHFINVQVNQAKDILNSVEIENSKYEFEQLVGFSEGFYIDNSPFNFVLVYDKDIGIERVFSLEVVKFELGLI